MAKRLKSVLPLFLLLLLFTFPAGATEGQRLGGYELAALKGPEVLATDTLLGKPVLLVFFTPSCPYCKTELTELNHVAKEYEEKGALMLALAPGWTPHEPLEKTVESWEVTNIPVYTDGKPGFFDAFGVRGVPFSVIFDKEGNVARSYSGLVATEEIRKVLDELLE
ncbi:TlpA family protein disulfide reductase [Aminiphilus circumscriptus]|jgi:thiol-disulfide isomerase/thioredoxin|uniref:TlpA family protein disulfide reductase n=1 Tax=Aminiphilus circumscriptus TaxID=290732 RepID=UPI00049264BB|nr:TlpA disulfide reductase family protein [Aminiphilus circumscriptus]